MAQDSNDLTHLVYEASLDNSLWPELILELTEHLQRARSNLLPAEQDQSLADLAKHFDRAFAISQRMVDLQEAESHVNAMLDAMSFGMALVDDQGAVIVKNTAMGQVPALAAPDQTLRLTCEDDDTSSTLLACVTRANADDTPRTLRIEGVDQPLLLLPRREATRMGLPPRAAAVLIAPNAAPDDGVRAFAVAHDLSPREADLTAELARTGDVRAAAEACDITYESARTYLKRIYVKTGTDGQVGLIQAVTGSAQALLRRRPDTAEEAHNVRRLFELSDGRMLEYFTLGPEDGTPVVHFDALAGVTIDVTGHPELCLTYLTRHNIRLIIPCRPGGFRSDPKPMESLEEFAPDIAELMTHLGHDTFSLFSVSYGSGSCLGVAHALGPRIERIVMSSPAYPNYRPNNWRDLDQYFQMSAILGRFWPSLLRQIIPFLVRSVMQNADRYFDRYVARCKCEDDAALMSDGPLRKRMATLLAERTASGMDGIVQENMLNARGWDFDLARITMPIIIVHGVHDNVSPLQAAEALGSDLPQARLVRLEDRGHYHHLRNWPWLAAWAAGRDVEQDSDIFELPKAA